MEHRSRGASTGFYEVSAGKKRIGKNLMRKISWAEEAESRPGGSSTTSIVN